MPRLAYPPRGSSLRIPVAVKIFREDSRPRLEEARGHHGVDVSGADQKLLAARRFEPRQHGLKEMHVRILLAAVRVALQSAVIASGRGGEMLIQHADRRDRSGQ